MQTYSSLFQEGQIGSLRLKNRLMMAAMGVPLADWDGNTTDQMIRYYEARARGGVGLITTQFASINADAQMPMTANIYNDDSIEQWAKLVDALHVLDTKVCIQLMHAGLLFMFMGFVPEGMRLKVPSITPLLPDDFPYDEITEEEIENYIEDFAQGARRASLAGADAVEIHASNGCLVSTFMSPITNRRDDLYGGSVENRTRFARRIVERIKALVGSDFPVIIRINVDDDLKGGVSPEEVLAQAAILEAAGVDAINISSGLEYWTSSTIPCFSYPDGYMMPMAQDLKKQLNIPLIGAGKIPMELAQELISTNKADFIALGRPLFADPDLPIKFEQGRVDEVRRCIYCNNCLRLSQKFGSGVCSVNPYLFNEEKLPHKISEEPKQVMVIGAGIAGMQAALFSAQHGHEVTLYEKYQQLGGQWNSAAAIPEKQHYLGFTDYLLRMLKREGVTIKTGQTIDARQVQALAPDAVITAMGATPVVPPIAGVESKNVMQACDVIDKKVVADGKVVVLGAGLTAIEVAIDLAKQNKDVCLVARSDLGGRNKELLEEMSFRAQIKELVKLRIPFYLYANIMEINDQAVFITIAGHMMSLPADAVVLATGMQPDNKMVDELKEMGIKAWSVGDCRKPEDAAEAAFQAAKIAERL